MNKIPYMVYTKSVVGHKVYAISKEDAIRAYKNGEEVDTVEISEVEEIDDVVEY